MPLTKKQQLFVDAYLVDPNGTKAAIKAGYAQASAAVEANRLLKTAKIAEHIARGQKLLAIKSGITPEMVIAELAKIGFVDIRRAVKWRSNVTEVGEDPDTGEAQLKAFNEVALIDSANIDDATAAAISEVSQTKEGCIKLKFHDKRAALVDIGRHLGMWKTARLPDGDGCGNDEGAPVKSVDPWDSILRH